MIIIEKFIWYPNQFEIAATAVLLRGKMRMISREATDILLPSVCLCDEIVKIFSYHAMLSLRE